jgi:mRNA interferase RelE/StbE
MAKPQNYRIVLEKKAVKEAENIPPPQRYRIDKALRSLSVNPRPVTSKKLTQKEGYRIRIGDYRILYTIDDKARIIVVYRIKIKGKNTYK